MQAADLTEAKSPEQYKEDTWHLFGQYQQFWKVYRHKRRVLLLTQENTRHYAQLIVELRRIIEKECKFNMFETLKCTLKILIYNQEEAFLNNDNLKNDLLTQIVLIAKAVLSNCTEYKNESDLVQLDTEHETLFMAILREQIESTDYKKKNPEFKAHLNALLEDFQQIERRMILVMKAHKQPDPLY